MNTCPLCQCEQSEGLLCHSETSALERELGDVAAIVTDLEVTLSKMARIGTGGKGGLARERMPLNVGAMNVADDLRNTLTTWARDVEPKPWGLRSYGHPSHVAARILLRRIPEIRRHPAVNELVDEITDAIRQARRVVDRPVDLQFVGPCLAEAPDDEGRLITCTEDLYARPGASEVRCKVCTTEHPVAERRAWLLGQARGRLFTVREAAQMMGDVGGIFVSEDRIRGYLRRNRLVYHPMGDDQQGILLDDLLKIVLNDAEKKSA